MLRPVPVKRFYLLIPAEKEEEVLKGLGEIGSTQLIKGYSVNPPPPRAGKLEICERYTRLLEKVKTISTMIAPARKKSFLETLRELFKKETPAPVSPEAGLFVEEIGSYLADIEARADEKSEKLKKLDEKLKKLDEELKKLDEELKIVKKCGVSPDALGDFEHIFVKAGLIKKVVTPKLLRYMKETSITCDSRPWSTADDFVVLTGMRDDKPYIEEVLTHLNFKEIKLPAVKPEEITEKIAQGREEAKTLKKELRGIVKEFKEKSASIEPVVERVLKMEEARSTLSRVGSFDLIHGWVPEERRGGLKDAVQRATGGLRHLIVEDPSPDEEPPSITKSGGISRYFDTLVQIRGRPRHDEINPTLIITFLFVAMFGMMFGDIGQGAVFIVLGYLLTRGISDRLRNLGGMLAVCGISALVFGFMYGTVFLAEVLHPILFSPFHNIWLMLKIAFFFGVAQITLGLVLNMVNKAIRKDWTELFGGGHGLAGLVFYLGFISLVILSGLSIGKIGEHLVLIAVLLLTLVVITATPVLTSFTRRENLSAGALEGFRGLLEVPITFLANSVSYLRIAAFALIHGGFSVLAVTLTGGSGILASLPVYILLNLLVIPLEGLIVSVHSLRLIYYEFFTKFYTGSGIPYTPFKI